MLTPEQGEVQLSALSLCSQEAKRPEFQIEAGWRFKPVQPAETGNLFEGYRVRKKNTASFLAGTLNSCR